MRVDSMKITGMNGIEVPDGTAVDDEFVLNVRVRVFAMERAQIDIASYGNEGDTVAGALYMDLVALEPR